MRQHEWHEVELKYGGDNPPPTNVKFMRAECKHCSWPAVKDGKTKELKASPAFEVDENNVVVGVNREGPECVER